MNSRSSTVDALRGLVLFFMSFNHLALFFALIKPFRVFTYSNLGIVTTAELFLAISAYSIIGTCRDESGVNYPWKVLFKKAKRRFVKIYIAQLDILIVVVCMSMFSTWHLGDFNNTSLYPPLKRFLFGSILLFQPTAFDILPMYLILSLLNPVLLFGFDRYRAWKLIVPSLVLWASAPFFQYNRYTTYIVFPLFHPFAWQFLYVCLFYVCFNKENLLKYRRLSLVTSAIVCVSFFIYNLWFNDLPVGTHFLNSTKNMGILRILNALAITCFCLSLNIELNLGIVTRFFSWIGKNALVLFCLHTIFLYVHLLFLIGPAKNWGFGLQLTAISSLLLAPLFTFFVYNLVTSKWNFKKQTNS